MSTEKLTQLEGIVVEPSLQNPDHFPQVECRPTSKTVLPLDRKKRNDYRDLLVATLKGDWETAKPFLDKDRGMVRARLTKGGDTVIHVAALGKCTSFVKELVDYVTVEELAVENASNDVALVNVAASGMVELAKLMVEKNNELPMCRGMADGNYGSIPFAAAAAIAHREMARYLYRVTGFDHLDRKERTKLFFICLSNDLYDLALEILKRYPTMAYERDEEDRKTALHVLAQKDITFSNGKNIMEGCTTSNFRAFFNQESSPNYSARELLIKSLWEQILQCSNDEEISDLIRKPSGVVFDAAKSGNVEVLAVLLHFCPDLLWECDENNRSLFHVAVIYRQVHVFNLIYNVGTVRDCIIGNVDNEHNSMQHLAGMLPPTERLGAPRANLQMQREILWFKEVEKISRPCHLYMRNRKGMTPKEVFNAEHKELLKVGETAMKETANSCMLVATLISTVVFAAALCVPGASNQLNTPFLTKEEWFKIFVLSNALSLFTSTTSIVLLLSILTSSYAESEFVKSLHARLMFGLTALFISITTMVLAFIAAIFLIFDYNMTGVPYAIASLASTPVIMFVLLHFNLWADLIRSYYWSKFLFQPSKYKIFE